MAATRKPAESAGLVSRFRQKLFTSRTPGDAVAKGAGKGETTEVALVESPSRKSITLKAGLAELLLITRLKARSKPEGVVRATDILERATHIVFVTCKNWFKEADGKTPQHRNPL
ncbi:MAG: hypothetical protein ABIP46_12200 [Polaromonas sp.]